MRQSEGHLVIAITLCGIASTRCPFFRLLFLSPGLALQSNTRNVIVY